MFPGQYCSLWPFVASVAADVILVGFSSIEVFHYLALDEELSRIGSKNY